MPTRRKSDSTAPEFISAAVSSSLRDMTELAKANDKTVAYYEGRHHGFVLCDVTADTFDATLVTVHDKDPIKQTARADKSVRYRIAAGDPEPHRL